MDGSVPFSSSTPSMSHSFNNVDVYSRMTEPTQRRTTTTTANNNNNNRNEDEPSPLLLTTQQEHSMILSMTRQDDNNNHNRNNHGIDDNNNGIDNNNSSSGSTTTKRKKLFGLFLLVTVISLIIWDHLTSKHIDRLCYRLVGWIELHPFAGMVIVVGVYVLATLLFVPGSILTIGTGYAFRSAMGSVAKGVAFASTAVFLGASLGSICSFLLGRYLLRDFVSNLSNHYPVLQAIDKALEGNGFKIMVLLRLSPLIPYNALDYISGVTSISFWEYSLALIGILPGTIMFCFIGATASSVLSPDDDNDANQNNNDDDTLQKVSLILGVVFAVLGVTVASYYSKVELDKIVANDKEQKDHQQQQQDQQIMCDGDDDNGDNNNSNNNNEGIV